MEFKGTREKWELYYRNSRCCISQGENKAICDVWGEGVSNITNEEMTHNALLISKAPEMLKMLIEVSKHHKGGHSEIGYKIKQLIKEATEL
jgi:hypothetical protein